MRNPYFSERWQKILEHRGSYFTEMYLQDKFKKPEKESLSGSQFFAYRNGDSADQRS
jgi:hypothetical protein